MATNLIHVKVKETFTYNGRVVIPNDELIVDAKIADKLSERNLVTVVGEEIVEDEQTDIPGNTGDDNADEHTDELDGMTVDELKEYASEAGIDLKGISKKADIVAAIREAM